jgi:hypothetical protein
MAVSLIETSPLPTQRIFEPLRGQSALNNFPKDSGTGGRWFKSSHPDRFSQGAAFPGAFFSFVLRPRSGSIRTSNCHLWVSGIDAMKAPGLFQGEVGVWGVSGKWIPSPYKLRQEKCSRKCYSMFMNTGNPDHHKDGLQC